LGKNSQQGRSAKVRREGKRKIRSETKSNTKSSSIKSGVGGQISTLGRTGDKKKTKNRIVEKSRGKKEWSRQGGKKTTYKTGKRIGGQHNTTKEGQNTVAIN